MSANLQLENQNLKIRIGHLERQLLEKDKIINNFTAEKYREILLEGIEKYVVSKRPTFNFSSEEKKDYTDWFDSYIKCAPELTIFPNYYALVKYNIKTGKRINFTENADTGFKVTELAIPVVNEGWTAKNTKVFLIREFEKGGVEPVMEIVNEEFTEETFKKEFSFKIEAALSYSDDQPNFFESYTVLLFVRDK